MGEAAIIVKIWRWRYIVLPVLVVSIFLSSISPVYAVIDWSACRTEGGTTTIAASANTQNVTLTTAITDTTKAFLLVNSTGASGVSGGDDHLVTGYIANTTTLTFDRGASPTTAAQISYSVVECFNSEFTVQRGAITIGSGVTSNTATINSVSTARSIVLVSSRTDDTTDNEATGLVTGTLTNGTTVSVQRTGTPAVVATVRYEVVEFSVASSVAVQTGSISLSSGNASATATINSSATARSWVYCSWDATDNGLQQTAIGCELTNSTTITAYRDAASAYTNVAQYYVVEFPISSITVQRGSGSNDPGSSDDTQYDQDITISAIKAITKAFPYITNTTTGTGTTFPRNKWISNLTSTTNLRASFWRGSGAANTNDDNVKYWQVIEFPMAVPVTPSINSAEAQDRNPDLTSSAFSGQGTHTQSDWKVVTTADCTGGTAVWTSLNNATNKTSITVNSTTGTFVGALSGQTQLAKDTVYYACVRYQNEGGTSLWATPVSFNTNVLPVASVATLDSGAAAVTLTANTTKTVTGTATVTDADTCQDLSSVTARLYRTSVGHDGATNNSNRYALTCTQDGGSCTDANDTTATYTCTYAVQYYADGTDATSSYSSDNWTLRVTPTDDVGNGTTDSDTIEVNTLTAISASASIAFGSLGLGNDTGAVNQTITMTNTGNSRLDVNVSAYGAQVADGYSMICTVGTVPVGNLKYSLNTFTYASGGTAITASPIEVDADILTSTGGASSVNLYTGYKVPTTGVGGACSGVLTVSAVYDSAAD